MNDKTESVIFVRVVDDLKVKVINPEGGFIESQSVEALLLYDILEELKKLNNKKIMGDKRWIRD